MVSDLIRIYWRLLRGLLVLAAAGMISAGSVERAAKTAGQSLRTGLISLKKLNTALGM